MRKSAWVVLLFALLGAAFAQDGQKNELGLLLGGEIIPGRSTATGVATTFSSSIVFGANYARRLAGTNTALFLEFPFAAAPSHHVAGAGPGAITSLAALYVTPSLRLQLARQRTVSPWLSAGFGYGQYEGSQLLANGTPNPDMRQHVGAAQFGAGVDLKTPIRVLFPIGLRAEIRDYFTVTSPAFGISVVGRTQHNLVPAGGIVLRF